MRAVVTSLLCCVTASALAEPLFTRKAEDGLMEKPDVLVNAQGLAQHDLSIRGSAYSGAGLSLNGLNLKTPWSAHYNAELPALGNVFTAPKAARGVDNATGHLIGTAAYATTPRTREIQAAAGVGTKERYRATVYGSGENAGGYFDWEKARHVDHDANDLERFTGGGFVQFMKNEWMLDLMAANQSKRFGAQGYYGAPADVQAEQRLDDALLFASATKGDVADSHTRVGAYYRDFRDQYTLPSSAFSSDVTARNLALMAEGRTIEIQHVSLKLRGDFEHDRVSGDVDDSRTRGSLLALPEARFERFAFRVGLNSVFQTDESAEWLPVAGVDWFAGDNSVASVSYTETERQQDFQTLYYSDPYRVGNPLLSQQRSKNAELGFKQFLSASLDWRVAAFYRRLENATDWTQASAGGVWSATDLGELNMGGVDAAITYKPSADLSVTAFYQWMKKDSVDVYAGLYELDYPEHMFNFSLWWKFVNELAVEFAQTTRWQAPNNARASSDFGANATVGLHYFPRYAKNVRLSFLVENPWGSDFQSIPGLKPTPTRVSAGIAVNW